MSLKVLSVASEAYPFVKTGGLADVTGALPDALAKHGVKVTTLLPGYPSLLARSGELTEAHSFTDLMGVPARLLMGELQGRSVALLDAPSLFDRPGGPYSDAKGKDWDDNALRFAALGKAAAELAHGAVPNLTFDLVHAHDWQAAMALAYLKFSDDGARAPPGMMTVHNIAFQGRFGADIFPKLGLPARAFALDGVEYYGGVGFLKAGLQAADAITTVSPTYAREITRAEFGMGLEGLIAARSGVVSGIVNGIAWEDWSPNTDSHLAKPYDAQRLAGRDANRAALESLFGLAPAPGPLFIVVSRLTWQKGMDVLVACLDALVAMGGRLAVLGSGDAALEDGFKSAAIRHPGRIGVRIGYDEALSHLMQGGGDAIVIPSRFEPCGLTQLYGLRYGCVPLVARTGGLADTIIDANTAALAARVATGFQFDGVSDESLIPALERVSVAFADRKTWRGLQRQGMKADFSWDRSAKAYADLYQNLIRARP